MKLEVVIAVFTCDINATRPHNDSLIPSLLPSFLFLCHSLLFCCQQICPEWSWWGTRTPSWGHARCPSWDRRKRASWPSPAHPYSASIWRRRKSPWSTTAWLWTSGTLWFIYFSRVHAFSIQRPFQLWFNSDMSWVSVNLLIWIQSFTAFQRRTAVSQHDLSAHVGFLWSCPVLL